jgi:hypothetical protein
MRTPLKIWDYEEKAEDIVMDYESNRFISPIHEEERDGKTPVKSVLQEQCLLNGVHPAWLLGNCGTLNLRQNRINSCSKRHCLGSVYECVLLGLKSQPVI